MADIDVLIDFNEVDPAGYVIARSRRVLRPVDLGDVVLVGDDEGTAAKGRVIKVSTPGWIGIQLDGPGNSALGLVASSSLSV
jgi:hypothetical protein